MWAGRVCVGGGDGWLSVTCDVEAVLRGAEIVGASRVCGKALVEKEDCCSDFLENRGEEEKEGIAVHLYTLKQLMIPCIGMGSRLRLFLLWSEMAQARKAPVANGKNS